MDSIDSTSILICAALTTGVLAVLAMLGWVINSAWSFWVVSAQPDRPPTADPGLRLDPDPHWAPPLPKRVGHAQSVLEIQQREGR
jgi:hypothetical protein